MKQSLIFFAAIFFTMILFNPICEAQIASGGTYMLEQSVIATGGRNSAAGSQYAIVGTIGQSVAGNGGQAASFVIYGGFWSPPNLARTATGVSIEGRVRTTAGRGIRNVLISLTGADGVSRYTRSSPFGYYRFTDVSAGQTYILSVIAKRHNFKNPTIVLTVNESLTDIDFIANDGY